MQDSPATQCVLRVFSGPLQGCEFVLAQRRTLFVVGPEARFCTAEHPLSVPEDAIYIPLECDGRNFEVLLDDNDCSGCVVRILGDEGAVERLIPFQSLENISGLPIAVRPFDEVWRGELLEQKPFVLAEPEQARTSIFVSRRVVVGAVLVIMVGLAIFGGYASRHTPVSNVEALIAGGNSSMVVIYGRDRAIYVFADSERDAAWGRQVLVRNGYSATQVMTTYDERRRLESLVSNLAPQLAYHRMDLSDPVVPRLLISRQRSLLAPGLRRRLESALIAVAPYVREIMIVQSDDDELLHLAEQGLQRLALPFTRHKHADGVTFTVEGSLEDAELQALGDFVAAFDRQWGERYVHFAIELKDDWLKGKSFQYGPQGYIKMTPSSWYFPKPL
ncbi:MULTISPECIES: PrgH/EprH family type III secretion apparatus protein [Pseudomonas]|uniref:PrgH/EprH family type III secretion apparatus protein n=1 Tax=Pseudomonas asiatica TaxID=2219225 RepID=A0A9X4DEM0_9PSED|nr:PrgH/EprH family type III secretion apparatus protein [Pseudomonas asiatica]MDD2114521.1 PrgH/EprH family type III secretion apparatus protein [Pseudomonas asiatica]MEE1904277.1 PrgH/EprH family type III secretion apparatus protein [Pseudomonas inefficax]MEE1909171.1 PrgH/EprH family type III secretion apparatus protein [Pseudomonas inefficax]MEE1985592.1 PrgH/EprH family type III secretion apparatus protein [Pseudomonas inefficax]